MIGVASLAAAAIVAILGVVVHGHGIADMAIFAIALAVSVIPEGLAGRDHRCPGGGEPAHGPATA